MLIHWFFPDLHLFRTFLQYFLDTSWILSHLPRLFLFPHIFRSFRHYRVTTFITTFVHNDNKHDTRPIGSVGLIHLTSAKTKSFQPVICKQNLTATKLQRKQPEQHLQNSEHIQAKLNLMKLTWIMRLLCHPTFCMEQPCSRNNQHYNVKKQLKTVPFQTAFLDLM